MTRIHIVTGDKGNVGKSAWCAAMIEYYRYYKFPLALIDADSDSQTLSQAYDESFPLMLSDNEAYSTFVDSIYEIAYKEVQKKKKGGDVLVDLPAGGEKFINKWIDECAILDQAEEHGITVLKWWVSDSDATSIQLFEKDVAKYPDISYVFLKNMGKSVAPKWISFDKNENIKSLSDSGRIRIIEIPGIASTYLDEVRDAKAKLSDVLADTKFKKFELGKNMRIKAWVGKTRRVIDPIIPLSKVKATAAANNEKASDTKDKVEAVATS